VYPLVKKIDPGCKVLNGGLANGLSSVNRLYDNGAQGYFDILNVHSFETPFDRIAVKRVKAFLERTRKVMERNGDADKQIWLTEIGCPGVKKGLKVANWWMGGNPTEEDQARWVTEVYTTVLKMPYVEKIFWAFFRDTDQHWKNGTDYFGLIRHDFSVKPSYRAYQKLKK
jgi:exo-beta-1,3-glucanase (GH17 family)